MAAPPPPTGAPAPNVLLGSAKRLPTTPPPAPNVLVYAPLTRTLAPPPISQLLVSSRPPSSHLPPPHYLLSWAASNPQQVQQAAAIAASATETVNSTSGGLTTIAGAAAAGAGIAALATGSLFIAPILGAAAVGYAATRSDGVGEAARASGDAANVAYGKARELDAQYNGNGTVIRGVGVHIASANRVCNLLPAQRSRDDQCGTAYARDKGDERGPGPVGERLLGSREMRYSPAITGV
ncbi:hypothetical protein T492DRAFT_1119259 [Pavlovales sp. CCMP2436]|nr:hypothetical protein T492DRAFT_1119259 [Pavlovales sp. CCMP2436]